ncbi:lytic transglycosylase domain-containing protein [Sphingomonas gei]|uniref:Lytic transglycosylase domain-containing protein n=1 Tax=Sphingomonas gei TaxID=1395960 RepID=A0A4S1X1K8_9SPHN|nr:lytic transglycosylase domain-containing protein [Sphingomonas gei]TGX49215.1 lytic transglycosylase domain-containing protein [Sphingomonas gei]
MRNSFQSLRPGEARAAADKDPFAQVGVALIGATPSAGDVQPTAPILVPGWMRDGLAFTGAMRTYIPRCATTAYRPAGFLSPAAESRRSGFYTLMSDIACQYGIPTGLFDAMIIRESGYQPTLYSPKNAFGLTQLMPETAAGLGVNRYDTEQNLRGGAAYLRQQLDHFGQVHLALAAYNAGPGRVRNGVLPRIAETRAYVDNILLNWQRLASVSMRPKRSLNDIQAIAEPAPPLRSVSVSTY